MMATPIDYVFVVQHVHELEGGAEDVKLIGVFSSEEKAHEAVVQLRGLSGFSKSPDGFHVDRYKLDALHWVSGFLP